MLIYSSQDGCDSQLYGPQADSGLNRHTSPRPHSGRSSRGFRQIMCKKNQRQASWVAMVSAYQTARDPTSMPVVPTISHAPAGSPPTCSESDVTAGPSLVRNPALCRFFPVISHQLISRDFTVAATMRSRSL